MEFGQVWITAEMVGDVARDTATHRTTVARWLKRRKLPGSIQRLLNLIYAGDLAEISPAWRGWKLDPRTGKLFPPNGAPPFKPGHLYAMELNYQQISALKISLRETRESLAELQASIDPDSRATDTVRRYSIATVAGENNVGQRITRTSGKSAGICG